MEAFYPMRLTSGFLDVAPRSSVVGGVVLPNSNTPHHAMEARALFRAPLDEKIELYLVTHTPSRTAMEM